MAAYGGTGSVTGASSYGDLSKNDAFTIQKKMLPKKFQMLQMILMTVKLKELMKMCQQE